MIVDVPQLVADLESAGLADNEIAAQVRVSPSAVFDWKMGNKQPKLDTGIRLLILHSVFCPNNSPLRTIFSISCDGEQDHTPKRNLPKE